MAATFLRSLIAAPGYLRLPVVWAIGMALIIALAGDARDAWLLLGEALFCLLVHLNARRIGPAVAVHLVLGSLALYQMTIMELSRGVTHVGAVWFLILPAYAALFGQRQHVVVWAPASLLCLVIVSLRAPNADLLWQHPLTLPNLIGTLFFLTLCAYLVLRDRSHREAELGRALDRVQQAERLKGQLLATLSHELRTPATVMSGVAELMSQDGLTPDQQRRIDLLQQASDSLLSVLTNVLNLSRLELGQLKPRSEAFVLADVTASVERQLAGEAEAADCALHMAMPADLPARWNGDPGLLQQILTNLVSNAIKYAPGGWVRIDASCDDNGALVLAIEDNGCGISPDQLETIFEPYAQVQNQVQNRGQNTRDADRRRGVGLGLSIVNRLVAVLDGEIQAASVEGEGTRFTIRLAAVTCERQQSSELVGGGV